MYVMWLSWHCHVPAVCLYCCSRELPKATNSVVSACCNSLLRICTCVCHIPSLTCSSTWCLQLSLWGPIWWLWSQLVPVLLWMQQCDPFMFVSPCELFTMGSSSPVCLPYRRQVVLGLATFSQWRVRYVWLQHYQDSCACRYPLSSTNTWAERKRNWPWA